MKRIKKRWNQNLKKQLRCNTLFWVSAFCNFCDDFKNFLLLLQPRSQGPLIFLEVLRKHSWCLYNVYLFFSWCPLGSTFKKKSILERVLRFLTIGSDCSSWRLGKWPFLFGKILWQTDGILYRRGGEIQHVINVSTWDVCLLGQSCCLFQNIFLLSLKCSSQNKRLVLLVFSLILTCWT